jgi:glutamate formiminotransferase/glutamate formiminotransferase/formiminotetrahydrofolate cyclodeaminase
VPPLLAVPNVSEGRDAARVSALEGAFSAGVRLLDRHSDPDHHRTVFTLAAGAGAPTAGEKALVGALLAGAEAAIEAIDMSAYDGLHPAVGALDVCPIVWLDSADRGAAAGAANAVAEGIGALGVPVFLYGELAGGPERRERAYFRNGGLAELWLRMESGELRADHGPDEPHRRAGATLVTARPPLAAFNLELDSDDVEVARAVAAGLREAGGGPPGVRAIGLALAGGRAQVSTNVHDPATTPLALVVERARALAAPLGARPVEAELVGLIPEAALAGYPRDVPIRGFDPGHHTIERRLEGIERQPPPATD